VCFPSGASRSARLGAPPVNETVAAFIQTNGVKVVAQETLGFIRNLEIGLLDPQTAFDVGRRVNRPEADAVLLACGNWSTFSIIDQLERDLGKPVLTTNQVSLWHALKMMNEKSLGGLGVLLHKHLGDTHSRRQPMSAFGSKADITQTSEGAR
jgi:maleate cis-trans isomerase